MRRDRELARLHTQHEWDLVVIGGGATGIGCALDAASRGARVALLERGDLASGTSSRSTKLLHGGVRYLEAAITKLDSGQFNLVREALAERHLLLRLAPHLARELRLVTPLQNRLEAPYMWAGLQLYDRLSGLRRLQPCHHLSRRELARTCPSLRPAAAGVAYSDGQFDDARYAVCAAITAQAHGACISTYCAVTGLAPESAGWTITWHDALNNERGSIRAKAVINAAGPSCDQVRALADPQAPALLRVSSGIHLVLPGSLWQGTAGLLIPATADGRVLFALPWLGHLLVGTTDQAATVSARPQVSEDDIAYVLAQLNPYLRRPAHRDQVRSAWSGLRPLVAGTAAGATKALSRDHLVHRDQPGLITITGGKWTTYRRMASDAVNAAASDARLHLKPVCSNRIAIAGGARFHQLGDSWCATLAPDIAAHLRHSYGDRTPLLLTEPAERLLPGHPYLRSEVAYAAQQEGAATSDDILCRRTRLAFLDRDAAKAALPRVNRLLAAALAWSPEQQQADQDRCLAILNTAL